MLFLSLQKQTSHDAQRRNFHLNVPNTTSGLPYPELFGVSELFGVGDCGFTRSVIRHESVPPLDTAQKTLLSELAEWLGDDAVQLLLSVFGGQKITVPTKYYESWDAHDQLMHVCELKFMDEAESSELCAEILKWFAQEYGGQTVEVPAEYSYRSPKQQADLDEALIAQHGELAFDLLTAALGGQRIQPARKFSKNRLVYRNLEAACERLGICEARREKLCRSVCNFLTNRYAPGRVLIPRARKQYLAQRRRIAVENNPDVSANELATTLGISARWVEKIRKRIREEAQDA